LSYPIKVLGQPALLLDEVTLAVADVHVGFEQELATRGINIPLKTDELSARLIKIIRETGVRNLFILGDVKHHVAGPKGVEIFSVPRFFSAVEREVDEMHVVRGNHDGGIEAFLPKEATMHESQGFAFRDFWVAHGSAKLPAEAEGKTRVIIGHVHPSVRLRDSRGYGYVFQVWLSGKMKLQWHPVLIVMPSFNNYIGQLLVNERTKSELRGPLLSKKYIEMSELDVETIDGVLLGKLRDLFETD